MLPDWLTSNTTYLVLSIILNFIFVILLFFKSAINDIIKNCWIKKQEDKKEEIKRLVDLRNNLLELKTNSLIILANLTLQVMGKPNIFDNIISEYGVVKKAISNNETYYCKEIRDLFKTYIDKMQKFNAEILDKGAFKKRINEMYKEIEQVVDEMIKIVDKHLE